MSGFQGTSRRAAQIRKTLATAIMSAPLGAPLLAADTTYTGAAAGTWNVAANWNNGESTAGNNTFVDDGAAGDVNVSVTATATTGTLNISAGDQVTINNNVFLNLNGAGTISTLNNGGRIVVDSGVSASQFRFTTTAGTGVGTITGGGTITLNGPLAGITGTNMTNVVNVDNYIHGQGAISGGTLRFDNRGTIVADVNAAALTIDPDESGTQFTNTGTLRATNGGILTLNTGIFTNTGGTIDAQNGSVVNVQGLASVVGGTITTSGTGKVGVPAGQNGFFTDVVNNGAMFSDNNSDFGVANSFVNNGSIQLNAGASAADFEIQNDVSLSGTGQLIMSGNLAGINGTEDRRLTNGPNHTIRGQGSIGQVGIWVTNNGLIDADVPGGTLTLTADGTAGSIAFVNTGTMRATNGGTLVVSGAEGDFTNTGGLIEAQAGSQVHFVSFADVRGGTLTASGVGSSLRVTTGQNAFFENVVINGLFVSENNSDWGASVAITNNGTISLEAGASATDFETQNDVLLSGTGQLIMNGALAGINGFDNNRLTNAAGHTIRGQGSIGQVNIWVTNNGLIVGDVNGATLTLSADGTAGQDAFINTGTIRATNGGIVQFGSSEGGFNNTGGTIEAQNDSTVRFVNASILGGTFVSTGTGVFRVTSGNTVFLNDNTLNGTLIGENNTDIDTLGPIVNNGTILIDSTLNATDLDVRADTTLGGTGQLILSGPLATASGLNDQRLTNGTSHTIRGQGIVGGSEIWVTNNGTILADVSGAAITLAADGTAGTTAFISNGTIRATNAATIVFGPSEGGFSGLGSVVADANSNVQSAGGAVVNQGPVSGDGTFSALSGSNFTATNYRLANLVVNAATARIRADGGTLGTSKVNSLSLVATARMDVTDHDLILDYTDTSPIATIRPQIATAFGTGNWTGVGITSSAAATAAPTPDKTGLGYVEATSIFSTFPATYRGQSVDETSVLISYTLFGDSNLDRTVDIGDFARLAANFNQPSLWFTGDFNYSGMTEIGDFALLASNFNKALAADLPRGAVPEPGVAWIGCAGVALLRSRRRR